MKVWATIADAIECHGRCALVTVAGIRGSAPREPGARMVVVADGGFHGSIGGGELEWQAIAAARKAMADGRPQASIMRFTLGPDLGQCCGGTLRLLTETFDRSRLDEVRALAAREALAAFSTHGRIEAGVVRRTISEDVAVAAIAARSVILTGESQVMEHFAAAPRLLYLFGAGHVGRALMLALAPLRFAVRWVDQRESAFPAAVPANVEVLHEPAPARALDDAPHGAFVVVMTHSHALDLAIVHAALSAGRFDYVGLIGSGSKRARFAHRLRDAGVPGARVDSLVCPIGLRGIRSKEPAAIAVSIVAELLQRDEAAVRCVAGPASLEAVR